MLSHMKLCISKDLCTSIDARKVFRRRSMVFVNIPNMCLFGGMQCCFLVRKLSHVSYMLSHMNLCISTDLCISIDARKVFRTCSLMFENISQNVPLGM